MHFICQLLANSPVFDDEDRFLIQNAERIGGEIVANLNQINDRNLFDESTLAIACSGYYAFRSIWRLMAAQPNENSRALIQNDLGALIRKQCDSLIQFLYLCKDDVEERAQCFAEQSWLDRNKMINRMEQNESFLANLVHGSDRKQEGVKRVQDEVKKIIDRFNNPKIIKREKWYSPASLEEIASLVDLENHYDFFCNYLNGSVHSSSLSVSQGCAVGGKENWLISLDMLSRLLLRTIEVQDLSVDGVDSEFLLQAQLSL